MGFKHFRKFCSNLSRLFTSPYSMPPAVPLKCSLWDSSSAMEVALTINFLNRLMCLLLRYTFRLFCTDWGHNWKLYFWWRSLGELPRKMGSGRTAAEPCSLPEQSAVGAEPPRSSRGISGSVRRVSLGGSLWGLSTVRGNLRLPPRDIPQRFCTPVFLPAFTRAAREVYSRGFSDPLKMPQTRCLSAASRSPRARRPPADSRRPRPRSGPRRGAASRGLAPPGKAALRRR